MILEWGGRTTAAGMLLGGDRQLGGLAALGAAFRLISRIKI